MSNTGHRTYSRRALLVVPVVIAAVALQAIVGDFPVALFAFPLNVVAMVLWLLLLYYAYRGRATSPFARTMLSREATWLSLFVMAVVGIVLGLEREPSSDSWPVVMAMLFVLSHLWFVVLRGWRAGGRVRWRFTLAHVGLLMALGAGFWGAPDREQLRIAVDGTPSNVAYRMSGSSTVLDFELRLRDFKVESAEGMRMAYEAQVEVDGEPITLRVNHPYNRTLAQKIYLVSFGGSTSDGEYVVLEVVTEPWQWCSVAGIVMLIGASVMMFIRGPRGPQQKREGKEL